MNERSTERTTPPFEYGETFFHLISPEDYPSLGINPQDVPMGTFAAEDHPSFLPSRFGGNAYGLGLIEQSALNQADTEFLDGIDFNNADEVGRHARELNAVYQKLGLLIRFSSMGKRYFLIPINLVAHSLHEVKTKADEIEELIIQHIFETRLERLDIGLLTSGHDLLVHELTARLSSHRIFLFESIDQLRSWRIHLDVVVLPKDPYEFLLEQSLPKSAALPVNRKRLLDHAGYLAGKIFDILESNGKLHILAQTSGPETDEVCRIRFKSEEDLKYFLLFSHTFKTRKKYVAEANDDRIEAHLSDLHNYLNRYAFLEPHLKRLLDHQKPEALSLEEINRLPHLNLRLPQKRTRTPEALWRRIFSPYFEITQLRRKAPRFHQQILGDRLEIDRELPNGLFTLVARPREPEIELAALEEEIRASGMQGCSLPLVAEYRNTFRYVLDVLRILVLFRDQKFEGLSQLERTRLCNPFRAHHESFAPVVKLLKQTRKLERCREVINPDHIEGQNTPVIENLPKLSLHGFSPDQLREILLIVVGHTTMSRIVFGKLPPKTLKPITDRAKTESPQKSLDLLRVCRLMSLAEIIASLGDGFSAEQARELYRLYDDATNVATDPDLDWEKLHDLRISALGGVQNLSIREMMKFFNLFEFLTDWQEFLEKGPAEREAICDYNREKLCHMEEAVALAETAEAFKHQFMGHYIFSRSYFFRQFLDSEFHGTGHLFPKLGTRAGFILLWISVNASERRIINFNPMLSRTPTDRQDARIAKIKETLLRIPVDQLQPAFFADVRRTCSEGRPAFIFDSGLRLAADPETRSLDVSFVDVDEDIQQINNLLAHFEVHKLPGISLKDLQDLERRFSELQGFHRYLNQEGCLLQCTLYDAAGGTEAKEIEIEGIENRLKAIIRRQIFIPEEIFETINVLAKHCPEVLRAALPEFHALGNLIENWPTRGKQSLGIYVMRCLEKFQALVVKDRTAFQDQAVFYQLAKQEFGALAEEGVGVTHAQMDVLELLTERVQSRPLLYQALTFALLFQETAKIEEFAGVLRGDDPRWTHAAEGALVLERTRILSKYTPEPEVEKLASLLVRHHGLIGHVIQGEEPLMALARITDLGDERLLDAFALHSILAAAAVQEGLITSDLLDLFLLHRSTALQIIQSGSNWEDWLHETLRNEGTALLADLQADGDQMPLFAPEHGRPCGFTDGAFLDEALWHGRRSAALERLLKLMNATWVDEGDLRMHAHQTPVVFIYHKKKLKSVGLGTFEAQLDLALRVVDVLSSLTPEVRYYLLYCLDTLGGAMRVYDFHPLSAFLKPDEALKLLLIGFQAFHNRFGKQAKGGLVSFRELSQRIERRHEVLQNVLKDIPFPERCLEEGDPLFSAESHGELHFETSAVQPAVRTVYYDAIQFDIMVESLKVIWKHDELVRHFHSLLREFQQKLPYDTKNFEEELQKVFEEQQRKINDRFLESFQAELTEVSSFQELQGIQREMEETQSRVQFSEQQQFMLKEVFEFHRSRLRDLYLGSIYKEINGVKAEEDLTAYWDRLKKELFLYRSYVGKEYELLVAQYVDQRMDEIQSLSLMALGE